MTAFTPEHESAAPHGAAARWIAAVLLLWLALLVMGTGFVAAVLLTSAEDYADSTSFQVVLCMDGGAFGASLAALLAAGDRIARGWSAAPDALASGERRFNARLAPLLGVQPILGAALGMVMLLALSSAAVVLLRLPEGATFDPMGLLLASVIVGLFARILLARLRDSVEALFGRATAGAEADPGRADPPPAATSPAAAKEAPAPNAAPVSAPALQTADDPRGDDRSG